MLRIFSIRFALSRVAALVGAVVLLGTAVASAAESKPLFAVTEYGGWGGGGPTFVVYDDGVVVWAPARDGSGLTYRSRHVSNPKAFVAQIDEPTVLLGSNRYSLTSATDQPSTTIWSGGRAFHIYGEWRHPVTAHVSDAEQSDFAAHLREQNTEQRRLWSTLPQSIRTVLETVETERGKGGDAWLPPQIEVQFWGYDYAPEPSIDWPKSWPDLNAADTRKTSGMYLVYLPSTQLGALQDFLKTRHERGAVLIDGKKMAAGYRLPFPGESAWR